MVLLLLEVEMNMIAETLVRNMLKFLIKSFQVMDLKMATKDVINIFKKKSAPLLEILQKQRINAIATLTKLSVLKNMELDAEI